MIGFVAVLFGNSVGQTYRKGKLIKLGGGLDVSSTGNAHGTFYIPSVSLNKNRSTFFVGALLQKRTLNFSGARVNYSWDLTGEKLFEREGGETDENPSNEKPLRQLIHLNIFAFGQYIHNTNLSYSSISIEQRASLLRNEISWADTKLTTAEIGVGFELEVRITERIRWKTYVSSAFYYHINYINGMYHDRMAPTLLLGTGIHFCPLNL